MDEGQRYSKWETVAFLTAKGDRARLACHIKVLPRRTPRYSLQFGVKDNKTKDDCIFPHVGLGDAANFIPDGDQVQKKELALQFQALLEKASEVIAADRLGRATDQVQKR